MTDEIGTDDARRATGGLARFARACASHPWRVMAGWLIVTALIAVASISLHGTLVNEFKLPGSDTQRAADLLKAKFPAQNGSALTTVLAAPAGQRVDTPPRKAAIARIKELAKSTSEVTRTTDPLTKSNLSKTGRIAFFDTSFDKQGFALERSLVTGFEDRARAIARPAGVQLEFTGDAENAPPSSGSSEILGLLAALVVLMVLFRAFVPTLIPLIFAIVAVATAFLLLYLLARITNVNSITVILVPMIGLGVGIDYTLFIVTRFRQLLHDGLAPREAAAGAAATAGRAVIFAGLTVAISVAGLAVIGMDFITKMGMAAALGVVTSVILANTLLPAVLALLGHKVDRLRFGLPPTDDSAAGRQRTPIARWGRLVSRRAPLALIGALVVTLTLAAPITQARLGLADAGTAPKGQTTRSAYDLLSDPKDGFGPGFTAPLTIVVDGGKDVATKVSNALKSQTTKGRGNAAFYAPPFANKAGDVSIIQGYSKYKPQDQKTDDLVSQLRHHVIPATLAGTGAHAYVTGANAAFTDIGHQILSRLPWFLLFVIGVTMLVLAMAFRSLVIAVKAALTTMLSAFVGFGAMVFVIQLGHGLGITGLDRTGPIESFVPPIAFAILFGLSMDYEVFLMSRIREEHVHGKPTERAVTDGISAVGRVIVAAAVIMSVVFFAFILGADRVPKEFGLLLGIAILTDALVVRLTLVPALLTLLGERSWAMPRWLDRALPRLTIEPPVEGGTAEARRVRAAERERVPV